MRKSPFLAQAAALLATILCQAACERKATPATQISPAEATPQATPNKQGVTFGDGFHKEEATASTTLRWVRQNATLGLTAPAGGIYRLMFRPITVFSTVENTIGVSVNGQSAGELATHSSDFTAPPRVGIEVNLRAGANEIHLRSDRPEVRLGANDDRLASYGLILPVEVEKLP